MNVCGYCLESCLFGYGKCHCGCGQWQAQIQARGVKMHLGCFDNPEDAYAKYTEAAKLHFGEFARTA